jgi:hypothetical protein
MTTGSREQLETAQAQLAKARRDVADLRQQLEAREAERAKWVARQEKLGPASAEPIMYGPAAIGIGVLIGTVLAVIASHF